MQIDQLIALVHMERSHLFPAVPQRSAASSPALLPVCRLLSQIPDFIPLILGKGDRLYHTDAALIAGRVPTAAVKCPGGLRFIKPLCGLSDIMEWLALEQTP